MKKFLFTVVFMISLITVSCCQNTIDWPGKDYDLLLGRELVVSKVKLGYDNSYNDFFVKWKINERGFTKKRPCKKPKFNLEGESFMVTNIKPFVNCIHKHKALLTLVNSKYGTLYFVYSPKYKFSFPFQIKGGILVSDHYYDKFITTSKDDFTGEIEKRSPFGSVHFVRSITNASDVLYLRLESLGRTCSVCKKGVIILFEDGTKLEFCKQKIDNNVYVNEYYSGYKYSAFIRLSKQDIIILTTHKIDKYRLYIYDTNVSKDDSVIYREHIKSIIK